MRSLRRSDLAEDEGPAAALLLGGVPGGGAPCNESRQDGPDGERRVGEINLSGGRRCASYGGGWGCQEGR